MPRKMTQQEFEDKFYSIFDKEEFKVVGTYIKSSVGIDIKHTKCGTILKRKPNYLFAHKTCYCPLCSIDKITTQVTKGVNDIATTNLELFSILKDKEDGYKYRMNSNKKVWFVCPKCKQELYRKISLVNTNGLGCSCDSNVASYSERFLFAILKQINVQFYYQYSVKGFRNYRFDFYVPSFNKMLIELDGGIGHGKESMLLDPNEFINSTHRDEEKNDYARNNGFVLLRINCDYLDIRNRFDFIKSAFEQSELSKYINFHSIDYLECHKYSLGLKVIQIAEAWNKGIRGYKELKKHFNMNRSTIRRYLKDACDTKLINESYEEVLKINRKLGGVEIQKTKGVSVKCIETNEVFNSLAEAQRKYKVDLSRYFNHNGKYCGTLPDGTRLTWQIINE